MKRSEIRDLAICFLYQISIQQTDVDQQKELFLEEHPLSPKESLFFESLIQGVTEQQSKLDELISPKLKKWTMERLPMPDRAIIRMAVFELCGGTDAPVSVAISEAVQLARKYGTDESPSYINAILGQIAQDLEHETANES